MNQETINKIRQALEQATPGPWRKGTFNVWCDDEDSCICDLGQGVRYWYDGGLRNYMRQDTEERAFADSCLIPLLRNHAPALLDEIEQLRARVAELEAAKKTCRWHETNTDEYPGVYTTGCGHMFSFNEGDRADNGAVYCQYCGGLVQEGEEEE